jgi:RimJ/RimL family protein N-acetyltransferase
MKIILDTPRLFLREMTTADLDFVQTMLTDPEVMRFYTQRYTLADAQTWLERQLDRYRRDGHALWLVVAKETGQSIGQIGLFNQLIEGEVLPEVGYLVHHPFWRKGYACEAARAVRDHAFGVFGYAYVVSQIRPINRPSQAVARKMGMRPTKLNLFNGLEHVLWRVDRG